MCVHLGLITHAYDWRQIVPTGNVAKAREVSRVSLEGNQFWDRSETASSPDNGVVILLRSNKIFCQGRGLRTALQPLFTQFCSGSRCAYASFIVAIMAFPDDFEIPPKMSILVGAGPQSYTKSPHGRQAADGAVSKKGTKDPVIGFASVASCPKGSKLWSSLVRVWFLARRWLSRFLFCHLPYADNQCFEPRRTAMDGRGTPPVPRGEGMEEARCGCGCRHTIEGSIASPISCSVLPYCEANPDFGVCRVLLIGEKGIGGK